MKKYKFIILDDENKETKSGGWHRVFALFLARRNYTMVTESSKITLSDDSYIVNNAEPLEVTFYQPNRYNYSNICKEITTTPFQEEMDLYFIDMNWDNESSIKGTNIRKDKTLDDITFEELANGELPSELAGINLLNILPQDEKPKIVFSASNRTSNIRKVFQLLSNRVLTNDILIGEMSGSGQNSFIDEVERKVDAYLQSRQIAIINRQTGEKIQKLNEIVKAWKKGSIDEADELLIPDNGRDTNSENCWSLRTLFPKQVNRIELGIDVDENKKYILNVLNNFNFSDIIFWLLYNHGQDENGTTIDKWGEKDISNRLNVLNQIDFPVIAEKAINYKRFSEIEGVKTFPAILNTCRDHELTTLRQTVADQFSSFQFTLNDDDKLLTGDWVKFFAEYGVYIGDVVFLNTIANANRSHCGSDSVKLEIRIITVNGRKQMNLSYEFCNANGFNSIENLQNKIKEYFSSERYYGGFQLQQEGIEDLLEIMVKRYKAEGEIQIGCKAVKLNNNADIICKGNNKVSYSFTFKSKNTI